MRPVVRLIASSCCLAAAIAVLTGGGRPAEAAAADVGWCDEGPVGGGTGHEFGGSAGACYQCAPSGTCHLATAQGYCHEYHYPGTGCPPQ